MLNPEEYRDLLNRMQTLNDASLLRIVLLTRDEYKPESLAIAEDELRKRKLQNIAMDEFARKFPEEYYQNVPTFCPACLDETIDEPVPQYGIGVLRGHGSECDVCGSIIQGKWIEFIVPIFRIGKYRIKYLEDPGMRRGKFISRKLKVNSALRR